MIVYSAQDYPQLSDSWWELKRGKPSASNFDRIITPKKMEPSSSQGKYIAELVAEHNSFQPKYFSERGHPANTAIANGLETEAEARAWFALQHPEYTVVEVGAVATDDESTIASPDGLLYVDGQPRGGLEIKCPQGATQAAYLLEGGLDMDYRCQIHGGLAVSGLDFWWIVSYCVGYDPIEIRVVPDEFTAALKAELVRFNAKYQAALERIYPEMKAIRYAQRYVRDYLALSPAVELVNHHMHDRKSIGGFKPEAKRAVWPLLKAHAQSRGWIFDESAKVFSVPSF